MILFEEKDDRFYIDRSTLPYAGFGLFAKCPIKKGDWVEVTGVLVRTDSDADDCTHYAKRYKFQGSKPGYKIVPMGFAGIINHTDDAERRNCHLTKITGLSKRSDHGSEVVYQMLRDIAVGEELLGYYGDRINAEIEKNVSNLAFLDSNKSDWAKFLAYDLYNLKALEELL